MAGKRCRNLPFLRPTSFRNGQPAKLSGGSEKPRTLYRPQFLLRAFLEIQGCFEMIAHGLDASARPIASAG
jgi:hypothetical protein